MTEDPVVEEVHKPRERLLEQYGGIDGFLRHVRETQEQMKDRVVHLDPKPPVAINR